MVLPISFMRLMGLHIGHEGIIDRMAAFAAQRSPLLSAYQSGDSGAISNCLSEWIQELRNGAELPGTGIVFLGQQIGPLSFKNPFAFEERVDLFERLKENRPHWNSLQCIPLQDCETNAAWIQSVREKVGEFSTSHRLGPVEVTIVDAAKNGAQSAYAEWFSDWRYLRVPIIVGLHNTDLRNFWYSGRLDQVDRQQVPIEVLDYLCFFATSQPDRFAQYVSEWKAASGC